MLKKYNKEQIWSINGSCVEIIHYQSIRPFIQGLSLLFMILNGTLSFVGSQIISICKNDPHLILKPGLTGLSHLKSIDIKEKYLWGFENYYAMHYSLVFDIEILLKSIFKI